MLWVVVSVVFLLMRASPGDPVDAILGPRAPVEARLALRQELGLALPLPVQYWQYLIRLVHLDLGTSLTSRGQAVLTIIQETFPATAELALFSLAVALGLGVTLGVLSASHPDTALDLGGRLFSIITYALPLFWVGMLLQLIFAVQLGWFPLGTRFPLGLPPPGGPSGLYTLDSLLQGNWQSFWVALDYLALPSITLGTLISGIFERIVRVNLRQALQSDYVEAAEARGISPRRVLLVHALKNALIPVITVLGLTLAALLGGAILTEVTFSWPGLANRLYEAISLRDYPTVEGIVAFFAGVVTLLSLLIDLINAWIDPRLHY